ncbi:MAG: hypothetical protein Ct9H300mP16_05830 [Pseudomonadota bacterium]|nr:MAG: hypothetical protein Ct9H300mP16_05830 [Pseudomonadota bacterium]
MRCCPPLSSVYAASDQLSAGTPCRLAGRNDGDPGGSGWDRPVVTLTGVGCPFFDRCPLAIKDTCDRETPPVRQLNGGHAIECHRSEEEFLH